MLWKSYRKLRKLMSDTDFLHFQHRVSQKVYKTLGEGYVKKKGEKELVERLVEAIKGEEYSGVQLFGKKFHGSSSHVKFNYMGEPVNKGTR